MQELGCCLCLHRLYLLRIGAASSIKNRRALAVAHFLLLESRSVDSWNVQHKWRGLGKEKADDVRASNSVARGQRVLACGVDLLESSVNQELVGSSDTSLLVRSMSREAPSFRWEGCQDVEHETKKNSMDAFQNLAYLGCGSHLQWGARGRWSRSGAANGTQRKATCNQASFSPSLWKQT